MLLYLDTSDLYFEYFIKIFEILSISPQFLLFDMARCLHNQNKIPNYIKKNLNITCNIEASESVKNLI